MNHSLSFRAIVDDTAHNVLGLTAVLARHVVNYHRDQYERTILFFDTLRQRGDTYLHQYHAGAPPVLAFPYETIIDGRSLERPVNYLLLRILPDPAIPISTKQRPFVVIDPRAGHGPGMGGAKLDSEIGEARSSGHPVYVISFLPKPVLGQTIEDVADAEAIFLRNVADLHPDAVGKALVMGNCQAGWAGLEKVNPMRYTGGLLGGSWLTRWICDLGGGTFDGAWLIQHFENLNPIVDSNRLKAMEMQWAKWVERGWSAYKNIGNQAAVDRFKVIYESPLIDLLYRKDADQELNRAKTVANRLKERALRRHAGLVSARDRATQGGFFAALARALVYVFKYKNYDLDAAQGAEQTRLIALCKVIDTAMPGADKVAAPPAKSIKVAQPATKLTRAPTHPAAPIISQKKAHIVIKKDPTKKSATRSKRPGKPA